MPIYGENRRVLRSNAKRNWMNGNEYDEVPQTTFITGRQTATQPMKKRLIDQNRTDIVSVTHGFQVKEPSTRYNQDDVQKGREVSHHDNSSNHLDDDISINNFGVDELEDNETILFHNIEHEDNDNNDTSSCADHDEQQEYQSSTQQRHHIATVTPRKKAKIRNFDSVHMPKQNNFSISKSKPTDNFRNRTESSIDPGTGNLSEQHQKASYKDLLNMIKEKDKLIGNLQSENEGKEFVELNSIQEKSVVEVTKKYLFPYCQFIRNADVLDRFESPNSIGNMIMNRIGVKDNIRSNFWYTYKHIVRKAIKQQRNISHNAIRNAFISE